MPRQQAKPTATDKDRQHRALALRIEGKTLDEVATELEYAGRAGAYKAIKSLLDRRDSELATEYRAIEDARLDLLWKKGLTALLNPDTKPEALPALINSLLRVSERRTEHGY